MTISWYKKQFPEVASCCLHLVMLPPETCYLTCEVSDHINGKMSYSSMSHPSHSTVHMSHNMTQIQETGEEK